MQLTFSEPELEASSAPVPYDVLLGAVATVRLVSDDERVVYEEVLFPIVELALALHDWLGVGVHSGEDFSFDSLESDEPGLVWCRHSAGGWLVGSTHQTARDPTGHTTADVVATFATFVRAVDQWLGHTVDRRREETRP